MGKSSGNGRGTRDHTVERARPWTNFCHIRIFQINTLDGLFIEESGWSISSLAGCLSFLPFFFPRLRMSVCVSFYLLETEEELPLRGGGDATDVTCLCQKSDPRSREKSRETRVLPEICFIWKQRENPSIIAETRLIGIAAGAAPEAADLRGQKVSLFTPFRPPKKQKGVHHLPHPYELLTCGTRRGGVRSSHIFIHQTLGNSSAATRSRLFHQRREEVAHPPTVDNNVNKRISGRWGVKCLARYLLCGLACAWRWLHGKYLFAAFIFAAN